MKMTKLITVSFLLFCTIAHAENNVKISEQHFGNLGVTLGKLQATSQVPLLTAPAKVVVHPNKNMWSARLKQDSLLS